MEKIQKKATGDFTPWERILKELRNEAGYSQRKLAVKCGMPQRTIAEYENCRGTRELSVYKIERILDTLGYELDIFLKDKRPNV
jgi:transcriptional regulator with XRE-family HTH domain